MGKDTVHFKCHHCNHCCTDVVCLPTPWDVIRIVRDTGADPREFLEFITPDEIEEVATNDPTWLRCSGQKYLMALRRDENGCHFLNKATRYCSIYESRPLLCRLYPFKLLESRTGVFKGFVLHDKVGCPRHRDGVYQTGPLYQIYREDDTHQDDYHQLVQVFNRQRHLGKKPEDFISLFIEGLPMAKTLPESELPSAPEAKRAAG
ncbi:MAG: YkgJ family cysteine cluster protein [Candidatus Hydrogenedentes bacterium]|nr:YkgJ family cysteine cluster protein [Candidatus Hydrogenedentota bacterium]